MRLVLLTPGTGNFHCGSCLHDEALAKALRAQGHDASIVGLYLPLVLDDPAHRDAVDPEPQMGGINLYLQQKSPVFRHTPAFVDRLLDRPALLGKAANRADLTSARELGTMTVEMLRGEHGKTAKELHRLLAHLQTTGAPDVVLLNNALLLSLAGPIKRALGCVVACTLQGEDTFLDGLPKPWRQQAWSLVTEAAREADLLLPVSAYHAGIMRDRLSLPADKVRVVHNGIDTDGMQPADPPAAAPAVGYLARTTRSKGVFTLIDAFEAIAPHQPDAKLILVGTATAEPLGPVADAAAIGGHVGVGLLDGDTRLMIASKAIAADVRVYTTGAGKITDTAVNNSWLVGKSVRASGADGDEIEVATCFPVQQSV